MEYNRKSGDITVSTLQIQVDDVKNVMTQNIDKVLQREENLSELVDRTDDLQIAVNYMTSHSTYVFSQLLYFSAFVLQLPSSLCIRIIVWHFQKCSTSA